MFVPYRSLMTLGSAVIVAATALAQAPAVKPAARPGADPALATVNGEPITRSEIQGLLTQFSIPQGEEKIAYEKAIDLLVNTRLLTQFLNKQKIVPPAKDVDNEIARYEKELKAQNSSLQNALAQGGTTPGEFRQRIARSLQWRQYVLSIATDAELKRYAEQNRDTFNGAQVRASHILVAVDENASEEEKEKAKQKILGIKKDIDAGKIAFADAANKYSDDPGNKATPSGGDLDYFHRKGKFIEAFSAAAFGLKKNVVSEPVLTEYGWHLIKVTDRKEGRPVDYQQQMDLIRNQYAADLQNKIVTNERKNAKIEIKPMPSDLIPKDSIEIPADAPKGASPAQPKGTTAKPATPKTAAPK